MRFTNDAATAGGNAASYTAALLDFLGDRDPFAVQQRLVPSLRAAVEGLPDAALRQREASGKWSVAQVIQHLADTELVYGYRLRMMAAHDRPEIQGYDQDLWAERLGYNEVDVAEAIEEIEVLRRANHRLLRRVGEGAWDRAGVHSERGEESIRLVVRLIAAHDLVHLRQIERIKQTLPRR